MKKILITGGNGFLAKSFFEVFKQGYTVTALHRNELDCNDPGAVFNYLKNNRFDVIIQGATYDAAPKDSPKDPTLVLGYNLRMFFNLVRCSDYFGKLIY